MTNTLTEDFYDSLRANGPPETIYYGPTFKSFYERADNDLKEQLICDEIIHGGCELIKYIKNPSVLVTVAGIYNDPEYYNKISNPNKLQLLAYLGKKHNMIEQYINKLSVEDQFRLIYINPETICFLPQTMELCVMTIKLMITAMQQQTNRTYEQIILLGIKESRRCSYFDTITLFDFHIRKYNVKHVIKNIKFWCNEMVEMLMNSELTEYLYLLPKEYQTKENIIKVVSKYKYTSEILKYDINLFDTEFIEGQIVNVPAIIEKIPHEKQTDKMTDIVLGSWYGALLSEEKCHYIKPVSLEIILKHIPKSANVVLLIKKSDFNEELTEKLFELNIKTFPFLPDMYKTRDMCLAAVKHNRDYLKYCTFIDEKIMMKVDKSYKKQYTITVPKKERWDFIKYFNEDTLIKIIKLRPLLLQKLPLEKQTDAIIEIALKSDGNSLEYVINKTDYFEQIAVAQEPNAIKYTRKFLDSQKK